MVYQLLSSHPESKFPTLGGNPRLVARLWPIQLGQNCRPCSFWMFLVLVPPIFKGYRVYRKQKTGTVLVCLRNPNLARFDPFDPFDPKIQAEHLWFPEVGVWVLCQGRLGTASATWHWSQLKVSLKMGLCHQIAVLIGEMLNNWWIWRVPYFQTKPCCDVSWPKWPATSGYYILDFGPSHWKDFSSENCPEFIRVPLSDWIVLYPYYLYLNEALFQWVCRFRFLHHPNNSSSDAGSPSPRGFRTPSFAPHCGDWHRFLFFFCFFLAPPRDFTICCNLSGY